MHQARFPIIRWLAVGCAAAALGGCGNSSSTSPTPPESPQQVLLTAAHLVAAQPFRMSFGVTEHFTVVGPGAPRLSSINGKSFQVNGQAEQQSPSRHTATLSVSALGHTEQLVVDLYGGKVYVSDNGGTTFVSSSVATQISNQFGPQSALQYLNSIGTVTDRGPTTTDGSPAERYHATLVPAKLENALQSEFSMFANGQLSALKKALTLSSGGLDVTVDASSRLLSETGTLTARLDAGVLNADLRGTTLQVAVNVTAHFSDYGAAIVVTPPANVSSTASTS